MIDDLLMVCTCGHSERDHVLESAAAVDGRDEYVCLECPGYMIEAGGIEFDGYPHGMAWHMYEASP